MPATKVDIRPAQPDDFTARQPNERGDVFVALSNGSNAFLGTCVLWHGAAFGAAVLWHGNFAAGATLPAVGELNGDNRDDIVYLPVVRPGTCSWRNQPVRHSALRRNGRDNFAARFLVPELADVNNDGRDDAVAFTTGAAANVFVTTSTGVAGVERDVIVLVIRRRRR